MIVIVDTNVAIVANGKSEQASPECVRGCVKALQQLTEGGTLVLDDKRYILKEYLRYLQPKGQPGVGDVFMKWVIDNYWSDRCVLVKITPKEDNPDQFAEFPDDDRLKKFDVSDRKFVAVARTHPEHPPILNAVDTDWWNFRQALADYGIRIDFLCPDDVRRLVPSS